jgi:hypothetical protein
MTFDLKLSECGGSTPLWICGVRWLDIALDFFGVRWLDTALDLRTSSRSINSCGGKGKAPSSRRTPKYGLRWLDTAFGFGDVERLGCALPLSERESCVEPQHSK